MYKTLFSSAGLAALAFTGSPSMADEPDPALQDVIIVTGSRATNATGQTIAPEAAPLQGHDITFLTARTPGGARIGNGELSGQMQYRGLFGERLNLRVDGQRFASGGPNLMDPAFHYAPTPLVAAVVIDRGISPVSEGPGLAGGADAVFKRIGFADEAGIAFGYDLSVTGRSANDSFSGGGIVGAASDTWRFNLLGAWEDGDDLEYGDGTIGGSAFERGVYGLSAGVRNSRGTFSVDLRRQNTGPSGNPPFPMDIVYFDTDFARIGYVGTVGGVGIEADIHYTDVAHQMDNFSLRPAPVAMRQRATNAYATTRGGKIAIDFDAFQGRLKLGLDADRVEHDSNITNPAMMLFSVTPFPDVETDRLGGFAEWSGQTERVHAELGLRVDRHTYDAGDAAFGPALPMGPQMLAAAFNASDRSGDDTTVDAVVRLWTPERNGMSWRMTLAHKQQIPGYVQRFGWLPIEASGGLADGNIYVGDLALEPETAWIAEAGFDYSSSAAYLRPTVYIREIDNYVQGTAFDDTVGIVDSPVEMIAAMNGDPTPLRWSNVDARLYGIDVDGGIDLAGPLRVDGVFSYVRGERRDIDDALYRIAPPNLTLDLTWEADIWSATLESRMVARQDEVSPTNSEQETPGYVTFGLYGDWQVRDGVSLSAGVENLLDHTYRDHLAGYNRNGFVDVGLGRRLPGAGRGVFVRLAVSG